MTTDPHDDKPREEICTSMLRGFGAAKGNMGMDETSKLFGAAADEIDRLRRELAAERMNFQTYVAYDPDATEASRSSVGGKNELRLSDGSIDKPASSGQPTAWLVERAEGVEGYGPARYVTLNDAEAPAFWLHGEIAKGYTVTPLFARSATAEPVWDGKLTINSPCSINGVFLESGTVLHFKRPGEYVEREGKK